jgi:hypothetical protein
MNRTDILRALACAVLASVVLGAGIWTGDARRLLGALRAAGGHLAGLAARRRRDGQRAFHGPRWEQQALAVAANLSDEEWHARRELGMAIAHPEHVVAGNELERLERELWPGRDYVAILEEFMRDREGS